MKKVELMLAGVLAFSPALFAQQSTSTANDSQNASQSTTQSSQTSTTSSASSKSKLTADQKAELKQLRTKAKDACKADKTSDSCKTAKQDLRAKMDEYGVAHKHGHKKATTTSGSSSQSPS